MKLNRDVPVAAMDNVGGPDRSRERETLKRGPGVHSCRQAKVKKQCTEASDFNKAAGIVMNRGMKPLSARPLGS